MLWSTSKPGTCILHTLQETTTMKVVFMTMTNDHCYSNDQDLRPIKLPQNCGNPNSMSYENSSMPASLKLGPGEPSKLLVQEYSWVKFLGPNNNLNENLCDVEKACPTGSPGQHPSRDGREHLCGLAGSGCLWGGLLVPQSVRRIVRITSQIPDLAAALIQSVASLIFSCIHTPSAELFVRVATIRSF